MKLFFFISLLTYLNATDMTIYTFKKGNLRLSLSPNWSVKKENLSEKLLFFASNLEEKIFLKIESKKQTKEYLKTKFYKQIRNNNFKLLNFSDLEKEVEYSFDSVNGYIATVESNNKKGYFLISRDGVNEIQIYIYTDESKFSNNFKSMKETLSGISNNFHYRISCCEILLNSKNLDKNCKIFFENFEKKICKSN